VLAPSFFSDERIFVILIFFRLLFVHGISSPISFCSPMDEQIIDIAHVIALLPPMISRPRLLMNRRLRLSRIFTFAVFPLFL
jgi:hypothetical protein